MKTLIPTLIALCAPVNVTAQESAPAPAAATETLAQREYWANQMDYTQRALDTLTSTCGGSVSFAYDRASWWGVKDDLAARAVSPNGRCEEILNALINICYGDPEASKVVLANVKSVECGYGGIDRGFRLELNAGRIRYDVEVDRPNVLEEITAWLKSKM